MKFSSGSFWLVPCEKSGNFANNQGSLDIINKCFANVNDVKPFKDHRICLCNFCGTQCLRYMVNLKYFFIFIHVFISSVRDILTAQSLLRWWSFVFSHLIVVCFVSALWPGIDSFSVMHYIVNKNYCQVIKNSGKTQGNF